MTSHTVHGRAPWRRKLVPVRSTWVQKLVAARAPVLDKAVREQPAAAAGAAAVLAFGIVSWGLRSRRRRRSLT